MKIKTAKWFLIVAALAVTNGALAQKGATAAPLRLNDIVAIKQRAEAGDLKSQLWLAAKLEQSNYFEDALVWYRKAAEQGFIEAAYTVGKMLLFGVVTPGGQLQVKPSPVEGVKWTFRAATNLHASACMNMYKAWQNGLGVKADFAQAYAWLEFYADRNQDQGRTMLEAWSFRLDTSVIQEGRLLAKKLKNHQWPALAVLSTPKTELPLKLEGVTMGGPNPLATVNHRTLAMGETVGITVNGTLIHVKCLEIKEDSVLVEVAGEENTRWLQFGASLAITGGGGR